MQIHSTQNAWNSQQTRVAIRSGYRRSDAIEGVCLLVATAQIIHLCASLDA